MPTNDTKRVEKPSRPGTPQDHKHHWHVDVNGWGQCSCGAERQFYVGQALDDDERAEMRAEGRKEYKAVRKLREERKVAAKQETAASLPPAPVISPAPPAPTTPAIASPGKKSKADNFRAGHPITTWDDIAIKVIAEAAVSGWNPAAAKFGIPHGSLSRLRAHWEDMGLIKESDSALTTMTHAMKVRKTKDKTAKADKAMGEQLAKAREDLIFSIPLGRDSRIELSGADLASIADRELIHEFWGGISMIAGALPLSKDNTAIKRKGQTDT